MMISLSQVFAGMQALPGGVGMRRWSSRLFAGEHRSRFLGRGLEFYKKTPYDPSRHSVDQIDWFDTRDPEQIFVREALLLRENKVILVLDLSSSISFGVGESVKERLILVSAGTVGLTAAHNHDKVGLLGFADNVIIDEPPRGGEKRLYYLIRRVHSFFENQDEGSRRGTNFNLILKLITSRFSGSCTVFLFSDFVGSENIAASPLFGMVATKHELVCVIVDDPQEYAAKGFFGTITVQDLETGELHKMPIRHFRRAREEMLRCREAMREGFKRLGVESLELTYGNHLSQLAAFLKERRKR